MDRYPIAGQKYLILWSKTIPNGRPRRPRQPPPPKDYPHRVREYTIDQEVCRVT